MIEDKSSSDAKALEEKLRTWSESKKQQLSTLHTIGRRYEECTFESFNIVCDEQTKVLSALRDYAANAQQNLNAGRNVLLIGPKGTGKDHLLVSLSRAVFAEAGAPTRWINGVDLQDVFHRAALDPDSRLQRDPHEHAAILYISDPLPPTGALSESKQSSMFRLIDSRYRAMRPTWLSMNVFDGTEAEQRLGAQTVDRLRHNALVLFCQWESYRKVGA